MIKFYDSEILQILPLSLQENVKTQAISYAIKMANRRMIQSLYHLMVYAGIGDLQEEALDLLAMELRTPYYDNSFSIEIKRNVIKNTLRFYSKAGTVSAVEEMLTCICGSGTIEEWFEYGGEPGYFRILFSNLEINPKKNAEFKRLLNQIKRASSHLDKIIYQFIYQLIVSIQYKSCMKIIGTCILHSYIPICFLNGESDLTGIYTLDGYFRDKYIDFYPVKLSIKGTFQSNFEEQAHLFFYFYTMFSVKEEVIIQIRGEFYPRCNLPLFRLDGTQYLDGTHTLNEIDQDFELLFLDGAGYLDGEYITNGYMDSHNFDFYPLKMEIKGECEQKSVISGSSYSNTNAEIQTESNSFLSSKGICVEKSKIKESCSVKGEIGEVHTLIEERLTVEKDLYFLNGEQGLDGTVFLDADIYKVKI